MRNLIKAEWFRITRSGIIKWIILILILSPVIAMTSDLEWYKHTLTETLFTLPDIAPMLLVLFSIIGFSIGTLYQNRTFYHEIMNGYNKHKIIFSKIILYTTIMAGGIIVLYGIYFSIICIMNGTGDIDNLTLRAFLFILVLIHICVISVLLSISTKTASLLTLLARFMVFEGISYSIYSMYILSSGSQDISNNITDWLIIGQFNQIFTGKIDTHLILVVILSLIIEVALWYFCAYYTLKRKNFK